AKEIKRLNFSANDAFRPNYDRMRTTSSRICLLFHGLVTRGNVPQYLERNRDAVAARLQKPHLASFFAIIFRQSPEASLPQPRRVSHFVRKRYRCECIDGRGGCDLFLPQLMRNGALAVAARLLRDPCLREARI